MVGEWEGKKPPRRVPALKTAVLNEGKQNWDEFEKSSRNKKALTTWGLWGVCLSWEESIWGKIEKMLLSEWIVSSIPSHCCDKVLGTNSSSEGKGLNSLHFQVTVNHREKSQKRWRAAGHNASTVKTHRQMSVSAQLFFSFFLLQSQPSLEMVLLTLRIFLF